MGLVRATPRRSGRSGGTPAATDASGDSMRTTPVGARSASTRSWATSRPLAIIAARVQISSTSDRRWLDRNTVVPFADQIDEQRPQLVDALGVEAVRRFVEDEQARVPEECGRQAEPLAHAHRIGPHRPPADVGQPDPLQHVVDAPALRVRADTVLACGIEEREVPPAGQVRVEARALDERARRPTARPRRDWGWAARGLSTVPAVGNTKPSSIRMVVLLPAPLGPRKPNRSPSWTSSPSSSTASSPPG